MSCVCDHCGKTGRRRLGCIAPDDWLFLETIDETSREVLITYACQPRCALEMWRRGPGRLPLDDPKQAHGKDASSSPAFDVSRMLGRGGAEGS